MPEKLHIYMANNYGSVSIRFRNKDTNEIYAIDTYGLLQFLQEKFTARDFKNIPIARKDHKMTERQTFTFTRRESCLIGAVIP